MSLTSPQIVFGGAEIINPQDESVLFGAYIPNSTAQAIIELLMTRNLPFFVEQGGFRYGDPIEGYTSLPFKPLEELTYTNIPKICLVADHLDESWAIAFAENELTDQFPNIHPIRSWGPTWKVWDITSEKATKHLAVLQLAQLIGIKPEEMIGIGDGCNDYPLLSACGYKVAVETAPDELKAIADIIVPAQEYDGVAQIIEKLF